jgi:hypothetical protein
MTRSRIACVFCFLLLAIPASAFVKNDPELTQFGRDIRIEAGERMGDVTCINCSVYMAGQSSGEITTIHGNVILETGASVASDTTAVLGDVRLQPGTQIAGDVTAVGGAVRRSPQSSIAGDVTSLEGTKWVLAIVVPPLFMIGLIVALILWLVQRSRRPVQMPQASLAGQR